MNNILDFFGRDLANRTAASQAFWTRKSFRYWRQAGFPYPALTRAAAEREIELLKRVDGSMLERVLAAPSMVGLRLANSFHPQMWDARTRGRSPVQCFADDELLYRSLAKAIHFWPNRRCWNARAVRILMSIQNRARVSNFRPTVARALVDRFSETSSPVLDFSAGYGGRLLGSATLNRSYTGVDPASGQCRGLKRMATALECDATVIRGCAEDVMPTLQDASFGLVFSSPPYFRLERYSAEKTQSYKRHPSYTLWLNRFLMPVIENAHRLLYKRGRLVLNVSNAGGYQIADDANTFAQRYFGLPEMVLTMAMSSNPADKARRGRHMRLEPIYVYRK